MLREGKFIKARDYLNFFFLSQPVEPELAQC